MDFSNTRIAVAIYQDVVRYAERQHKEFCEALLKLEDQANRAIYTPEKINEDRINLVQNFQQQMQKRKEDLEEAVTKCKNTYEQERKPSRDTLDAFNSVLQYIQLVGDKVSSEDIKTLLQPIYEANDMDKFTIISNLLGHQIPLSGKMVNLCREDVAIKERFEIMQKGTDNLLFVASDESISSSLDPAKAVTQAAVGNVFTGLLDYTDKTKKHLEDITSVSKSADTGEGHVNFSFNFKPLPGRNKEN